MPQRGWYGWNEEHKRNGKAALTSGGIPCGPLAAAAKAQPVDGPALYVRHAGAELIGTLVCLAVALYLPAVYLVLKAGLERVRYFSEAVAVTALGVLIFADISYLPPVPSAADGRRGV